VFWLFHGRYENILAIFTGNRYEYELTMRSGFSSTLLTSIPVGWPLTPGFSQLLAALGEVVYWHITSNMLVILDVFTYIKLTISSGVSWWMNDGWCQFVIFLVYRRAGYSSAWTHLATTELTCYMGSHSVNCRGGIPALLQPIKAGTRFSNPRGMQGWVDLVVTTLSRFHCGMFKCRLVCIWLIL